MPVITVGGKTPQPCNLLLPVDPDENSLVLADVAWTQARIDAAEAIEQMAVVLKLAGRVEAGDRWMAEHPEDHPDRYRNGSLLYRLHSQLQLEQITLRIRQRSCWSFCQETHAIIRRSGMSAEIEARLFGTLIDWDDDEPALPLWRMLLPFQAPPEQPTIGGVAVILPRRGGARVAAWQLEELREALEQKEASSMTGTDASQRDAGVGE